MLLEVNGVVKDFADSRVLDGTTFRVDRREKVALVGRNGTGKTTLINLICGDLEPDKGTIRVATAAKIGRLRQEAQVDGGRTVLEEAEEGRKEALKLQRRLEELELAMQSDATPELLDEYTTLHEHFIELEGYSAGRDLESVLKRLGFESSEFHKPTNELSGGQKTRLALARLLLEEPDLLVLDEPTNHLDLQATEWLEGWIRSYPGAVLLVSHDREFLANTAGRVLHLEDGRVKSYPGGFDKYLALREEEAEVQRRLAKKQQTEIDKLDEYVRRFMGSERTAQARGRLKMLRKLEAVAVAAPKGGPKLNVGFDSGKRSGDIVIECVELEAGYGAALFPAMNWTIRSGERWGIVGDNGIGKSTLIKTALGEIPPVGGSVRLGTNLSLGYFAQDHIELDPRQTPIDYLVYDFDLDPAPARTLLGRFLISGDDVFRPIGTLSGGEKNKLVLAGLTTLRPNLLVLDEPTNHLDMDSRAALAEVLAEYSGTLVIISHDRMLLSRTTDHMLDVKAGGVVVYPGSFSDYRRKRPISKAQPQKVVKQAPAQTLSPREISKEIARLEKAVEITESLIARGERELTNLEGLLATPEAISDLHAATAEHGRCQQHLKDLMERWTSENEQLEALKAPRVEFRPRR